MRIGGELSFKCIDPNCTHYTQYSSIIGKNATCPSCHEVFVLTRDSLRLVTPKCDNCRNTKSAKSNREIQSFVDEVLAGVAVESHAKLEEKQRELRERMEEQRA